MAYIKVENLKYRYPNTTKLALDGLDFEIEKGSFIGIVGENGAGKSSTIKAILNLVHKETGDIYLFGHPMEGNEKEDGSNQWKEQLGVIFDECNMPVEFTAKEIHHIMNEFYRTWEGKEIFCLFKEASGSYRQEGKGFVEGNEIPDEQIIGKMENAYGAQVLVKNAAGWKQEGFVVDHASIEDILLYIVKRDEVR